jgi:hypothetical protein
VTQPWWNQLSSPITACNWKAMVDHGSEQTGNHVMISYAHVVQ